MTIQAVVRCDKCGRVQRYVNYGAKKLPDLFGKRKNCVFCCYTFVIKSATKDNIARIEKIS